MQPSVGRIVHYVSYGSAGGEFGRECRAAIITVVSEEHASSGGEMVPKVGLCVLNPTGQFFNQDVAYHDPAGHPGAVRGGTWHWPERVPVPDTVTLTLPGDHQPGARPPRY